MRTISLVMAIFALTACAPAPDAEVTKARPPAPSRAAVAPDAPVLATAMAAGPVAPARHGDAEVAATFMDLSFQMESGRTLPVFSRFEGPITVAMTGDVPGSAAKDLGALLARLRGEAGIDISPGEAGRASVTVEFRPKAQLRRLAPNAACFVVPNVDSLADYKARRGSLATDWATVSQRSKVAIFIPSDASPQEVRDCLQEELAQAIGPLNDLYRLTDSVFNDDNFQAVLTPFDMMILRATYSPELRAGMSKAEVQARIGGIVAGMNPGGPGMGSVDLSATTRAWKLAIETALGGGGGQGGRRAAAEKALEIARAQGWQDGRLAFSHFALARLHVGSDRAFAVDQFRLAASIYRSLPGGQVQAAHVDMQLAAIAVASGQPDQALLFADRALPVIRQASNMALLATTMLIKAEALDMLGRDDEAARLRLDSAGPARYGFGGEAAVRARTREIALLGARGGRG